LEHGEQLRQGVTADLIVERHTRRALDCRARVALESARATRQNDLHAVIVHGAFGDGGVPLRAPVSEHMARAGTHDESGAAVGYQLARARACVRGQRYVPAQQALAYSKGLRKAEEAVEHVLASTRSDARVREQPLQLAGSWAIEAQFHACAHA